MKIKCYIIGAGPGDFGLLTLRAYEMLCQADSLIYDHLIPEKCLDIVPSSCKKINVGKIPNQKSNTQSEINQILIKECLNSPKNKIIVRIKGGDPFIYGRGKEEINILQKNQIPYEVIPGVSSFYAVPSYAGIPLTSRDYAESFSVITGHFQKKNNSKKTIVSDSDTVVYLMGVKNLEKIVKANLDHGKEKQTPIAIIENGCTPFQKTTIGTLENILEVIKKSNRILKSPAIIIIGKVVSFRNDKNTWYENKDLFQKKIVIFKTKKELPQLVKLLEELGAIVIEAPLLYYQKVSSNETKLISEINKKFEKSAILFTSSNSVDRFFEIFKKKKKDTRYLANYKIIAIGKGTADSLKKYFVFADYVPNKRSQEGVWQIIKKNNFKRIIYPRPKEVRNYLQKKCNEYNIKLISIITYKMVEKKLNESIINTDLMLLTSGNIIPQLEKNIQRSQKLPTILPPVICMGKNTENKLKKSKLMFSNLLKLKESSYTEMVKECISFFKEKN